MFNIFSYSVVVIIDVSFSSDFICKLVGFKLSRSRDGDDIKHFSVRILFAITSNCVENLAFM